jgi:superfamily II DNA or RNA helicase
MYRGVDIPRIDNVIIASPIRFENTVIQSIGRALRPHLDKAKIKVNVINDDVLQGQRREQTKACIKEYNVKPDIIYIK